MLDWLNEPCYQQLLDFLSYLSLYISVKDPDWLDYQLDSWVYIKRMDYQPGIQARHLIISSCEHIHISLE